MKNFLKGRIFRLIASLALAAIFYFLCPHCFSKLSLFIVLAIILLIINLNTFFGRFRILTHVTRFAVGGLFVFSGFIKANDPVGFSIKLQEYFDIFSNGFSCEMQKPGIHIDGVPCVKEIQTQETIDQQAAPVQKKPNAFWDFFAKHSLFLAIFICGFEMAVGFCLLLGIQVRWTLLLLLAMIVFFAFLTFYSACCNKVQSCGCFGDAIKLTPWESFWKDLILLILICVLFVGEKNIGPLFKNRIALAGTAGIFLFASFAFPVYTWRHLPLIDFRAYKIGTNLWDASQNKRPPDCLGDSTYSTFYYQNKQTKKIMHFHSLDSIPDSTWEMFCRDDHYFRHGNCGATVLDFYLEDYQNGNDYTDSLLKRKGVQFFLILHDLNETNTDNMDKINALYDACVKNNIPFNALCGSNYTSDPSDPSMTVEKFSKLTGAKYPFLSVDGTALKTAIRSNPGLMMLKDGVVTALWSCYDIPSFDDAMKKSK